MDNSVFFVELPPDHEVSVMFKTLFPDFNSEIPLPFIPTLQLENENQLCDCGRGQSENGYDSVSKATNYKAYNKDSSFEQKSSGTCCDHHPCTGHTSCTCNDNALTKKATITADMIVAGLLSIFAHYRDNSHFEYYKELFLALKPKAKKELLSIAMFELTNFDFEESLLLLSALEGLYPDDAKVILSIAQAYEKRAVFYERSELLEDARLCEREAESYYSEAILKEPPLPETFFSAGFFYLSQKNYAKARTLFNTYINLDTEKSENAKYKRKQVLSIIESINLQELDDLAYSDAIAFIKNDEDEKALSRIRDFLAEHPKSWNGWFVLGWALRKLERFADAEKAFLTCLENGKDTKSLEIEQAYSDICNELSLCYVALNQNEKAKTWLFSAFELDCENIKLISNLGMIYFNEGDLETAKGYFNTVLTLSPNDKTALTMLEKIEGD